MSEHYDADVVRQRCHACRQYLSDLLGSNFEQAPTKLRLFVNYCESDEVLRELTVALHPRVDVQEWFRLASGQGSDYPLPEDRADRLALLYLFLYKLGRRQFDLRQFLVELMPGASIEAKYGAFIDRVVQLFHDETEQVLTALDAASASGEEIDVAAVIASALAGLGDSSTPEPVAGSAPAPAPAPGPASPAAGAPIHPTPKEKGQAANVTEVVEEEPPAESEAPEASTAPAEEPAAEESKKDAPRGPRYKAELQAIEDALTITVEVIGNTFVMDNIVLKAIDQPF